VLQQISPLLDYTCNVEEKLVTQDDKFDQLRKKEIHVIQDNNEYGEYAIRFKIMGTCRV
jgi:hypothetical protein